MKKALGRENRMGEALRDEILRKMVKLFSGLSGLGMKFCAKWQNIFRFIRLRCGGGVKITFSKKAVKAIARIDVPTKHRIRETIHDLPDGDVKRLTGNISTWRLRVGEWRVLYSFQDSETILIEKIAPRGQVYKEG